MAAVPVTPTPAAGSMKEVTLAGRPEDAPASQSDTLLEAPAVRGPGVNEETGETGTWVWEDGEKSPPPPPPEPYCWEDGGDENAPATTRLWHTVHWTGMKVFHGMEFAGDVLAEFFGLNQSKYQWVIDQLEREREEKEQLALERQQRRELALTRELQEEQRRLETLESGAGAGAGAGVGAGAGSAGRSTAAAPPAAPAAPPVAPPSAPPAAATAASAPPPPAADAVGEDDGADEGADAPATPRATTPPPADTA